MIHDFLTPNFTNLSYVAASVLFILGLKMLSSATTARRGNMLSALGMLIAVVAALYNNGDGLAWKWIAVGVILGSVIGYAAARLVRMTAMPEMVALFNGFGGLASLLVGWAEYHKQSAPGFDLAIPTTLAILVGGIAFTGSIVAFGKLSGQLPGKPILFPRQHLKNLVLGMTTLIMAFLFCWNPEDMYLVFLGLILLSLALGIMVVLPIGGADMPVVIALLNSYSGLAACAAGFVILNNVLIVAGALVGASGLILTRIMCKAMNRSLANVLFSGFGTSDTSSPSALLEGEPKPISPDDAYYVLEAARSVIFVPGYGMAVAQAQHAVRELAELLEANGTEIKYVIHPVAGRMPGHMNVLLAEANIPYELMAEPEDVNPSITTVDVAIVIGANDVVNPAAHQNEASPIYGMPIIDVGQAKTCLILKRSMNPGFAGIKNSLFVQPNTHMLFGDAKKSLQALASEFKDA